MKIHFRMATIEDVDLYYKWSNDKKVRENSYQQNPVLYEDHVNWFTNKLASPNCYFFLFLNDQSNAVGQVRIDQSKGEIIIGISIDSQYRGYGLGVEMLNQACNSYLGKFPAAEIFAYIKEENKPSYHIFKKAGFTNEKLVVAEGVKSYRFSKTIS